MKERKFEDIVYICPICYNAVQECTCDRYPAHIVKIDKGMQKVIQNLNLKGYRTRFSCEGHLEDIYCTCEVYINFSYMYDFAIAPPRGARLGTDYSMRIKLDKSLSQEEFDISKRKVLEELEEWSSALESIKE